MCWERKERSDTIYIYISIYSTATPDQVIIRENHRWLIQSQKDENLKNWKVKKKSIMFIC